MKTVIVISMEKIAMENHVANLKSFFSEKPIAVKGYYYHGNHDFPRKIDGDLIVLSSQELTATVWDCASAEIPIIYMERTLYKRQADQLRERILDSRVMFVDYREDTAMRMISCLTEYGMRGFRMIPVGQETAEKQLEKVTGNGVTAAITAGLQSYCPEGIREIIDVGWAPIDAKTILEISVVLNLYDESVEKKLFRYMQELITSEKNIMFFMKSTILSENTYKAMMENMEDGVLIADQQGRIRQWNRNVLNLLKIPPHQRITAEELENKLPATIKEILHSETLLEDKLLFIPKIKQNLVITKQTINVFGSLEGYMLILKGLVGVQQHNARIRRQMYQKNYRAKYTFDDILGTSDKILQIKQSAKRLAKADATVLITGESGTGKELFAQSIHNASDRGDMPFVAINCAALSPALLESELFGYDRGAFTDAKSEGHVGVFEMAHKGTVFLDEIGELSMNVQAKLLRVLEEREIRRVGGEENIPINVRIIAATNQDLLELIRKKQFRQDLYFRLNVLPLRLIPLRERREDILVLAKHFLEDLNAGDMPMTQRLMDALCSYPWEGNGRELYNCMQYMACLSDHLLDTGSLPEYLKTSEPAVGTGVKKEKPDFLKEEILAILEQGPVGREALAVRLNDRGIRVSEYAVRRKVREMKTEGLIGYGRGRNGISAVCPEETDGKSEETGSFI